MNRPWFALVESNTTGTGRDFAEAARRRGLRPVLLTCAPHRYRYVEELRLDVVRVDTADPAAVETACRDLRSGGLSGVSSSSEYFVHTAALVAARLGRPGPDAAAVARCRDKAEQRQWLARQGIPVPDFQLCATAEQAADTARALAAPVVVKPVCGSGSRGVRSCAGPAQARDWANRLLAGQARGGVLVEREIHGVEYSVEIIDGAAAGVTRKHLGARPYFVETGHDFPVVAGVTRVARAAVDAVREIGLTAGPAHVEVRVSPDGRPWLVEINPRLAGGLIPRLVRHARGRDLVDEVVAAASGGPPSATMAHTRFASIRFVVPARAGIALGVTGLARTRALAGIVEAECAVPAGTAMSVEHSFADRVGHVIAVADTAADAIATADRAVAGIAVQFAPADTEVGAPVDVH